MASDEYRQAMDAAAQHRQRAGELYARHRSEGRDELLTQARSESSKAAEFEEKAQQTRGKEKDPIDDPKKRAWFEPGSVAEDPGLQLQEAGQGGILSEVSKYAARSVFDKNHRDMQGAKMAGKAASAPFKAARAFASRASKGGHSNDNRSSTLDQCRRDAGKQKQGQQQQRQRQQQQRQQQRQGRSKGGREPGR